MTMPRIAVATLPAQKARNDDHTYHPIVIEGTRTQARDVADHAIACPLSSAGGAPRRPPAGKIGLILLIGLWILEKIEFLVKELGGGAMAWKSPKVIEIAVGMEINCYACAEL